MAGGAPILVPVTVPEEKILCIADLEKAGSRKMEKSARGESKGGKFWLIPLSYFPVMLFNILLICVAEFRLSSSFLSIIFVSTYKRMETLFMHSVTSLNCLCSLSSRFP
jgi:hypothetical protein